MLQGHVVKMTGVFLGDEDDEVLGEVLALTVSELHQVDSRAQVDPVVAHAHDDVVQFLDVSRQLFPKIIASDFTLHERDADAFVHAGETLAVSLFDHVHLPVDDHA